MLQHRLDKTVLGLGWSNVMGTLEALRTGCDLLRAGPVDVAAG